MDSSFWYSKTFRRFFGQLIFVFILASCAYFLLHNMTGALNQRGLEPDYYFLNDTAGFDIGEHLIDYSRSSTYGRAFLVGILNTLLVSSLGIVFATILGVFLGIARLSSHPLLKGIASFFVQTLRNIPLLVLLIFWKSGVFNQLPIVQEAIALPGPSFLSNRGLNLPWFDSIPILENFNIVGGFYLSSEFIAILSGLVLYHAAFIAEIVRSGIQSVSPGQREAAKALGLGNFKTLRIIILPQATQVAIPPLISMYLNLIKNSSLAAYIGFPDLFCVAGTILNQTGRAVEVISLIMLVYLFFSLLTSFILNTYNRRQQKKWGRLC